MHTRYDRGRHCEAITVAKHRIVLSKNQSGKILLDFW